MKRYPTTNERITSNQSSTEGIANRNSSENVEEAFDEQFRVFIAPLTRQLDKLTRLVQRMAISRHPNSYLRIELDTTSGTAMPQSNIDSFFVGTVTLLG